MREASSQHGKRRLGLTSVKLYIDFAGFIGHVARALSGALAVESRRPSSSMALRS